MDETELEQLPRLYAYGRVCVELEAVRRIIRRIGPSEVKDGEQHSPLAGATSIGADRQSVDHAPRPRRPADRGESEG